jgi:hypothetical protein
MAVAADPGGAVFGIWQGQAHTGVGLANEPGSLCWNENIGGAYDQNQAFYQAVFGYEYGDLSGDGYRYATLKLNGTEVGGIGEAGSSTPGDVPAHWATYFGAADTDAAVRAVSAAGGRVIQPPRDSPYGRIAVVTDDQGATFSLISPPPR